MPKSKAQIKATTKYDNKSYDKFLVLVPKGHKAVIKDHAKTLGESLSGYAAKSIQLRMEREI